MTLTKGILIIVTIIISIKIEINTIKIYHIIIFMNKNIITELHGQI